MTGTVCYLHLYAELLILVFRLLYSYTVTERNTNRYGAAGVDSIPGDQVLVFRITMVSA